MAEDAIFLRDDRRIDVEQFESFEAPQKWEELGDGKTQVTYLTLKCKDGEEIEILRSEYRKEILRLKQPLEKWINENHRDTEHSSHSPN